MAHAVIVFSQGVPEVLHEILQLRFAPNGNITAYEDNIYAWPVLRLSQMHGGLSSSTKIRYRPAHTIA